VLNNPVSPPSISLSYTTPLTRLSSHCFSSLGYAPRWRLELRALLCVAARMPAEHAAWGGVGQRDTHEVRGEAKRPSLQNPSLHKAQAPSGDGPGRPLLSIHLRLRVARALALTLTSAE
jgi:hypothetical protein